MTFEHRLDGNEEAGLRKYFAGRENSRFKSLELGVHMVCKRNSKKARVARAEQVEGIAAGDEVSKAACSHRRL